MLLIRAFEPEAERQYKKARVGGYCHPPIGQEAAHVGVVGAMRDDDAATRTPPRRPCAREHYVPISALGFPALLAAYFTAHFESS